MSLSGIPEGGGTLIFSIYIGRADYFCRNCQFQCLFFCLFFFFFGGGVGGGVLGVNKNNYFLGLEIFVDILGGHF